MPSVALHPHLGPTPPIPVPTPVEIKVVQAYPFEGHNGDTIYVSGTGFRPYTRLRFLIACPKWDDITMAKLYNYDSFFGPVSDGTGGFLGWPLKGFLLHGVSGSPCVIYIGYFGVPDGVSRDFVADINALYTIIPSGERLAHRATHIDASVTPLPKKVKAGLLERIHIGHGWGGALADVLVTYPHLKPVVRTVRLDWKGEADVRIGLTAKDIQPGLARVEVRSQLGTTHGSSFASFMVVR